jgi:hypothetical protein
MGMESSGAVGSPEVPLRDALRMIATRDQLGLDDRGGRDREEDPSMGTQWAELPWTGCIGIGCGNHHSHHSTAAAAHLHPATVGSRGSSWANTHCSRRRGTTSLSPVNRAETVGGTVAGGKAAALRA